MPSTIQNRFRKTLFGLCFGAVAALAASACSSEGGSGQDASGLGQNPDLTLEGAKPPAKPTLSTPTLNNPGATQTTIFVEVCAGATGAPAGFSLQWVLASDLAANGGVWPESTDAGDPYCKASFSGNANESRFPLDPYECATVEVGNLFDEEPGVSFTCNDDLLCGTEYAFRAFAHANADYNRSAFTPIATFSTLACDHDAGCTFTQGYWKTHGPAPTGNNVNEWNVTSLTLGTVTYTDAELQSIFDTPAKGNGLLALAHQLIAAKLNIAEGADGSEIQATIDAADALIAGLTVPPVGSGFLSPSTTSALTAALAAYNEGLTGPGHCGSEVVPAP